ncbi:phosphoribosylformylglycinamidine synthase [Candidatus Saccharibacteria bacterium]|nr:phosphoribosylformylglycinamidine synthase [Candidatus Saccharibacteria bacterium]
MLIFGEVNALASFKKDRLLEELRGLDENIIGVSAEFIHFIENTKPLDKSSETKLKKLLTYDESYEEDKKGEFFLVTPRPGTISPWSSKATDIARSSNLKEVKRIERGTAYYIESKKSLDRVKISKLLADRMTQVVLDDIKKAEVLFKSEKPRTYEQIDLGKNGFEQLGKMNKKLGLALSDDEIEYLVDAYKKAGRNPTDVELMMFSVVNSEHCRHKIFNADWLIDGKPADKSLFKMIKNTYQKSPEDVLSAYSDNAAVLKGPKVKQFFADQKTKTYSYNDEAANIVIKVETHNHPTAIAPYPGASTGVGGEIRDEAATGRGAKSKMGLTGFNVSNLNIPGYNQPWEKFYGKPDRIVSALDIMIESPLGGAGFANEFGRPNLAGYFRTYEQEHEGDIRGYHKPIMIAGGMGNVLDDNVSKGSIKAGDKLIVLGGPAMLIGLGGGSASSIEAGKSDEDLDFASVQRDNAEMQRRAQEVINSCWNQKKDNPIISIHDVGAGGLSNAFPELVHDQDLGGEFELRDIPNAEPGLSPLEIWCNEAQERYVLAISEKNLEKFKKICEREKCPFAVIGTATKEKNLVLNDRLFKNKPIDIPMSLLFGNPPKMTRKFETKNPKYKTLETKDIAINEAVERVLRLPAVASKKFLITIGDRTVGGLVTRDQMVGPWQVPVSDVSVTAASYNEMHGEAVAIGERSPIALINSPASGRMAVGEVITNIISADIEKISDIKLSANWMAAAGHKSEDKNLYETVKALGEDFCPDLGICIPVGKDSLSMRTSWDEKGKNKSVTAPLSVVISGFAPVSDTSKTLTPELKNVSSELILIDLGEGKSRLGASAFAQTYSQVGNEVPDANAKLLKKFFKVLSGLKKDEKILAYHDRSDGGLITTLLEMSFASRLGLDVDISEITSEPLQALFNEELGAVIQVSDKESDKILEVLRKELGDNVYRIGKIRKDEQIVISRDGSEIYKNTRAKLESYWAETSYQVQKLRDNPRLAEQEFKSISDDKKTKIVSKITFENLSKTYKTRPKAAILREQGVNGQLEMAAAFDMAGFETVDVHLNDLVTNKLSLKDFSVLAACGGFSYGDVLGAGQGVNKSILFNDKLLNQFKDFFERKDTLTLGVCNGCQMLSGLKDLIPGAEFWPKFSHNLSGRFEARLVNLKINKSPSILFKGMDGSILPIPVAHGEGRVIFDSSADEKYALENNLVSAQYVDGAGNAANNYPANPNGSKNGMTSMTSLDGRATILMPHPERVFLTKQLSWRPENWDKNSPWLRIFQNARDFIG